MCNMIYCGVRHLHICVYIRPYTYAYTQTYIQTDIHTYIQANNTETRHTVLPDLAQLSGAQPRQEPAYITQIQRHSQHTNITSADSMKTIDVYIKEKQRNKDQKQKQKQKETKKTKNKKNSQRTICKYDGKYAM